MAQVGDEGEHLHRLPQPHLVRQDAVLPVAVEGQQPLHALHLVRVQREGHQGLQLVLSQGNRVCVVTCLEAEAQDLLEGGVGWK